MAGAPSGTVTFLFTDVEGSTVRWERSPALMRAALAAHDDILRSEIERHDGFVFATGGDGFAAAFARADAALAAAVDAQHALADADELRGLALKVRMGLHTGQAHERDGDYFGPAVNRAARAMEAANGSQVFVSAATREVLDQQIDAVTTLVDLGVHQLRDVVDPVRLFQVEHPSFVSDRRPPRTGSVRAGNLPVPAGPLLGRDDDVDTVLAHLATSRLVTLTGTGGIGKTRLAVEAGRRLQPPPRDGVWFVGLDVVDEAGMMLRALLGTLRIERQGDSALSSLVSGLRFRHALVILDNCEHLIDAVADAVAAVLAACPGVQILATSREPLDVDGERVRRVAPLDTEDGGPAAALFRLRAAEAGRVVDAGRDRDPILRICRRLDGLPLAIELAAARSRSLRPADIADRLDDMHGLLRRGRRAGSERHRTLRATLEWSYELLREPERVLFGRLSVFAGSFPLRAVEPVAGGAPIEPGAALEVLDQLVGRSLVVPLDGGDESRFRLLEPVRQLAAEVLAARGETDVVRRAHTRWCLDLLVGLSERWRTGDDQGTWPVAAVELANLEAAFVDLVGTRRVEDAQRFAVAGYGPINCHFDNLPLYEWAPRAADLDPAYVGPATASVCAMAAWGALPRGDVQAAASWLQRGAAAIERGSDDDGLLPAAAIHHVLFGGTPVLDDDLLRHSLNEALSSGDLHRQVWVLTYAGRPAQAIASAKRLGNRMLLALAHSWVLYAADDVADWEARELFWEAAQRSHSFLVLNNAAHQLGAASIRSGAVVDGLLLLRAPARDWLLRGDSRVWDVLHSIATGLAVSGHLDAAARLRGAVGDRYLSVVPGAERAQLTTLLEALSPHERRRHESDGALLDAGAAVTLAFERIEALASPTTDESGARTADSDLLTSRQREVAALVARGLTNKQIARRLGISRFTAETHVRNILDRLGAASRAEIAAWATEQSRV